MKCFVIMPFGNPKKDLDHSEKLESIYSDWIKPTVESIILPGESSPNITCHRTDETLQSNKIIQDIIENLATADIVIADLSGRNPNVFYELGVRHSINNNTILISESIDDIPFDLRGVHTIEYSYNSNKMLKMKESLCRYISQIVESPQTLDNPVRRFLYTKELDKLVSQNIPQCYDVIKEMLSEISTLKKQFRSYNANAVMQKNSQSRKHYGNAVMQKKHQPIEHYENLVSQSSLQERHDLKEALNFIKNYLIEQKMKISTNTKKIDRMLGKRTIFWQQIETIDLEIKKYVHNK